MGMCESGGLWAGFGRRGVTNKKWPGERCRALVVRGALLITFCFGTDGWMDVYDQKASGAKSRLPLPPSALLVPGKCRINS